MLYTAFIGYSALPIIKKKQMQAPCSTARSLHLFLYVMLILLSLYYNVTFTLCLPTFTMYVALAGTLKLVVSAPLMSLATTAPAAV